MKMSMLTMCDCMILDCFCLFKECYWQGSGMGLKDKLSVKW